MTSRNSPEVQTVENSDYIEVGIHRVSAFVLELPDVPDGAQIELTILYADNGNVVNSEAWLQTSRRKTMKFLADVCELESRGMSKTKIENALTAYHNDSDVFADSVSALISEDYDYFILDKE